MRRVWASLLAVLVMPVLAAASEVQTRAYRDGEVVSLQGWSGYALDLEFEAGERIVNVAAGSLGAIEIGAEANHLFLKPRHAPGRTDVIVLTDRRTYRFDYRVAATAAAEASQVIYALVFTYPTPKPVEAPAPPRTWNADYWFRGAKELKPSETFDDGSLTFLRFGTTTELPVPYAMDPDGQERLVNSHVSGDWMIVHQPVRRLILRRGSLAACIENRAPPGTAGIVAGTEPARVRP